MKREGENLQHMLGATIFCFPGALAAFLSFPFFSFSFFSFPFLSFSFPFFPFPFFFFFFLSFRFFFFAPGSRRSEQGRTIGVPPHPRSTYRRSGHFLASFIPSFPFFFLPFLPFPFFSFLKDLFPRDLFPQNSSRNIF